jgi:predicted  nucleic acid-binding Zn-ribbon protein
MSRVSALYHVQELDLQLDACRARLAEIAKALESSPAVQAARVRLTTANARLRSARTALNEMELENQSLSEKIKDAERRLYGGGIRNPKELRDLQADVESLKRRLAAGEERQLEALIETETAETQAAGAQGDLQLAEAEAAREHGALMAERETLQGRVEAFSGEREALYPSILAADRGVYERLRATKHGRALSRLEDGTCAACGIAPSAAIRQEARRGSELVRCSGCDRILYAD